MFEPEAYKITADPYVPFSFLALCKKGSIEKKKAALAAKEKPKKKMKGKGHQPDDEGDDEDDDDDDDDDDDAEQRKLPAVTGGLGRASGIGGGSLVTIPEDGWATDRREIYKRLDRLLMTKIKPRDEKTPVFMAIWSISCSQLPL